MAIRHYGDNSEDSAVDTMLRDIGLNLGAAFIIVTLIFVIFQKIENRPKPIEIPMQVLAQFLVDIDAGRQNFREIGLLDRRTTVENLVFYNEILRGGYTGTDLVVPPESVVFEISLGREAEFIVATELDTAQLHGIGEVSVIYMHEQNPEHCEVFQFSPQPHDSTMMAIRYITYNCRRLEGRWIADREPSPDAGESGWGEFVILRTSELLNFRTEAFRGR